MDKIPYLDINCIPSQLNTSNPTGVASQLASMAQQPPHYDGVTLEQMRGNPLYDRLDDIDKIGLAQQKIADAANVVKGRAKYIRALNDHAQKLQKPNIR